MKKLLPAAFKTAVIFLSCCLFFNNIKAQYVTVPDTDFVNWLDTSGFAGCLNGNQLDTTCTTILTTDTLMCYGLPIHNLTGVQYFKNLTYLDCSNDSISFIPTLPPAVIYFNCSLNWLDSVPTLPATLTVLHCENNWSQGNAAHPTLHYIPTLPPGLDSLICYSDSLGNGLPALPASLQYLDCNNSYLASLPALPASLTYLSLYSNGVSSLPALPAGLQQLLCQYNQLLALPALPAALTALYAGQNRLTALPALPASLLYFECFDNNISVLPAPLPANLKELYCTLNPIDSLPALPATISVLICAYNNLTTMPALPAALGIFDCSSNQLTQLPAIPAGAWSISLNHNKLTWLPALPVNAEVVNCSDNLLTALPALPTDMSEFYCTGNHNLTCLPTLGIINTLRFDSTAITCLPNYGTVNNSTPPLNTVPLCGIYNPGNCPFYWNVSGQVYYDANADCIFDGNDVGQDYIKMKLYSGGILQQQIFTSNAGEYSFKTGNGNYTIVPDTTNLPFAFGCPDSGYLNTSLSALDTLSYNNNFALTCRNGFDVGVTSIVNNNVPRPGAALQLNTLAGDISELYGAHCAAGISGQVQITYTGAATYTGPAASALTPAINGNTLTYTIADYGAVNDLTAFNTLFKVNNNAIPGSQVCFTVTVTPAGGDYNPANNTLNYCLTVVNALDPNSKEVYPANVDSANQWLTYTIRFQNTGTAAAVNIIVADTLDSNLDPSTFQLLAYSAKNVTQLFGNVVDFNFPNINLPDSLTSDSLSRGYVQYRVKTIGSFTPGNKISNTASIYFDLNPAVVTNTVVDSAAPPAPTCVTTYDTLTHAICQGDTFRLGSAMYTQAGNYLDTLTNVGGCDSVVSLRLTLDSLPVADAGADFYTCSSLGTTIGGNGVQVAGTTYQWSPSAGLEDTTHALSYFAVFNTTGHSVIYTYVLTATKNGCSSSDTLHITVGTMPVVTFNLDSMVLLGRFQVSQGDTIVCESQLPVQLAGGMPPGGFYDGNGVSYNTLYQDTGGPGRRPLEYIVSDSNGCINYSYDTYYLEICNDVQSLADNNNITLYPNPATDQLYIKTENIQPVSIIIYDADGRMIYTMPFTPTVNVNALSSGVYFVEVKSNEGVARKRFVKM